MNVFITLTTKQPLLIMILLCVCSHGSTKINFISIKIKNIYSNLVIIETSVFTGCSVQETKVEYLLSLQNYAITDVVQKISSEYGCKPVEGMLSHQLKQFRIDGEKSIIQNPSEPQRKEHEKTTLETYEVYAMDVLVSTGEGVVCILLLVIVFSILTITRDLLKEGHMF